MTPDQIDAYRDFARDKLGVTFKDINILITALTHRSYINEHKKIKIEDNERLEYLGDAVLEFVITEHLFKAYPRKNEGILTRLRSALVKTETNAKYGFALGLDDLLRVSRGEKQACKRVKTAAIADAYEAVIGAIFLDLGLPAARKFILDLNKPALAEIISAGSWRDPKSALQELIQQGANGSKPPRYRLISSDGPDHDRIFTMAAIVKGKVVGTGTSSSKQSAEALAAEEALEKLGGSL